MPVAFQASPIPAAAGIGLKPLHYRELLEQPVAWLEIHPENYLADGGSAHHWLSALREMMPLSFHSIGLSLASGMPPDREHLRRLKILQDRYRPALFSDHLSWSRAPNGTFLPDLLPVPYTEEALTITARNIRIAQDVLERRILIENPSTYWQDSNALYDEPAFLNALCQETGCGLLLDINNIIVSTHNHGLDATRWLEILDSAPVEEIHLAGHATIPRPVHNKPWKIDDHGSAVSEETWALLKTFLRRHGKPVPALIEWDMNIPTLSVLRAEAATADRLLREYTSHAVHAA